jgi:hypothetical protein
MWIDCVSSYHVTIDEIRAICADGAMEVEVLDFWDVPF